MPSEKRVHWAQLRTGILAAVGMAIAAVLIFLLTGQNNIFGDNFTLHTHLEDAAGMVANDPVRLNGILVGYIGSIKLSGSRDPRKAVEVNMVVRDQYLNQIPDDSKASISSSNLLGAKFIDITKGTHPKHVEPGGEVEALPIQDVPEILAQSANLIAQIQTIVGRADGLLAVIESGQGNIGKLIKDNTLYDRLSATAGDVQQLVKDVRSSNGTISHLLYDDELYKDIRKPIQRIDDMLAQVQSGKGTLGKAIYDPRAYDEAQAAISEAKTMLDNLNKGQGTAGKFLTDDQIYQQLTLITRKVNTAIDKIQSGQGTLGQLVVNPQLYDTVTVTTRDLDALLKDLRTDPKKFLHFKLALF